MFVCSLETSCRAQKRGFFLAIFDELVADEVRAIIERRNDRGIARAARAVAAFSTARPLSSLRAAAERPLLSAARTKKAHRGDLASIFDLNTKNVANRLDIAVLFFQNHGMFWLQSSNTVEPECLKPEHGSMFIKIYQRSHQAICKSMLALGVGKMRNCNA